MKDWLRIIVLVIAGGLFIIGGLSWVDDISSFLQRDRETETNYERMRHLNDSLKEELMKRNLSDSTIFSSDKMTEEDLHYIDTSKVK